jgi:hypothetical protein
VRSDGVIVAAIEKERVTDAEGRKGMRAQIHVSKREGAWTAGPVADTFYGSEISQRGDTIVVQSPNKKKGDERDTLGLDAGGRWIPTDFPDEWLAFTGTNDQVSIDAPTDRPGFPKRAKGGLGMLGAIGGLRVQCQGVGCLEHRTLVASAPGAQAFGDGVCAKDHVKVEKETIPVFDGAGRGKRSHDEEYTTYSCDKQAPAQRASTLLVRAGAERRVAKLPVSCATGRILGSERGSFVYCSAEHRGHPSILHVSPAGALSEVASGIAGDLDIAGSESASDGTTVIYAHKTGWVCTTAGAPSCKAVPYDRFLAARPLPEGRALVARQAGARELELELLGEAGAVPVHVMVSDNVLDLEVTAEGNVRLWTSRTQKWMTSDPKATSQIEAFLVRSDGQLVADAGAAKP